MTQERSNEARAQGTRSVADENQAVRAMRKAEAEEVASGLEAEGENRQGSPSVESEAGVVVGNEIA